MNIFFVAAIADIDLILFASKKAKNLGGGHGALFLNFRPEVPQKNSGKKFFEKKSIFSVFQKIFWGTSGSKFEKRPP